MRIGTIGTGTIVNKILDAVQVTAGITCEAVYSRSEEKGRALAKSYDVQKVYTDLEEMMQDETIDCVYVASPNSLHYEHTRLALEYGKNVICEKPFTSNLKEARELIELAKIKQLFLFEGITTAYVPNFHIIQKQIEHLGEIRLVLCNFSQYSSRYDVLLNGGNPNVFNPDYSGGALMDINYYNVYFAVSLFGKPESVKYYANIHKNGIDTSGILMMDYPKFICECAGAKDTWGMNEVQIQGENGYLYVKGTSSECKEVSVNTRDKMEHFNLQEDGDQWYFEIQSITEIFEKRDLDRCFGLLDTTSEVMEVIDNARKSANILFKADL